MKIDRSFAVRGIALAACAVIATLMSACGGVTTVSGAGQVATTGKSKAARSGGSQPTWVKSVAYSPISIGSGECMSMAIVNGRPAMAFCDSTHALRYIRASNATGTQWSQPAVVLDSGNLGPSADLAVINGNPAVTWTYSINTLLDSGLIHHHKEQRYARADDADGSAWGAWVVAESRDYDTVSGGGTNEFRSPTLFTVDGNPAICSTTWHLGEVHASVRYIRAADANGQSWGVGQTIDPGAGTRTCGATTVNGQPAVCYTRYLDGVSGTSGLFYLRATDADGTTWGAPLVLNANYGSFATMAVVNGNPAVGYGGVSYVRATDVNGDTWGTALTVGSGGIETSDAMAIVNGKPAVVFHAGSNHKSNLLYADAKDASGNAWNSAQLVDGDHTGILGSLTDIGGKPAIAYVDSINSRIMFAIQQ